MQPTNNSATVPSLIQAQNALAELATEDALGYLESAIRSLEGLSTSLRKGDRLPAPEQRLIERSLLRFRAELRDAGILAERGLAYCQDWTQQMQPASNYQSNGILASATFDAVTADRHELSLEA